MRNQWLGIAAALALGAVMGLSGSSWAANMEASGVYRYKITRNGDEIGFQSVSLQRDGAMVTADLSISMQVKFGFLTLYHYQHKSHEVWRSGVLHTLEAETVENGKTRYALARREGDVLKISGSGAPAVLTGDMYPTSYWNVAVTGYETLFNTEDGAVVNVRSKRGDPAAMPLMGREIMVHPVQFSGDLNITLLYDAAGLWLGSRFEHKGAKIEFDLVPQQ